MWDRVAFGVLVKQKRGAARLTQETLAEDIFGDPTRKGDISRIERGRITPQEATIQKLLTALGISEAEMAPIRQARPVAEQLSDIPSLSREQMQNLGARFELENPFDLPDAELRRLLTLKADEYRALKAEVDQIDEGLKRLSNLKTAAQDAIARADLDEVEELLSRVQEVELEEAAKTAELRAQNALLRGKVEQAYSLLCAAADSFAAIDPVKPARRRCLGAHNAFPMLFDNGQRYGGKALAYAQMMIEGALSEGLRAEDVSLWAAAQTNLGMVLYEQGNRFEAAEGKKLLSDAVNAFRAALDVSTRETSPARWGIIQNNIGLALQNQGGRSEGAEGAQLMAEAVSAYRSALSVRTKTDEPERWAITQNNLGIALSQQGTLSEGKAGVRLLAEAIVAYRAALEVFTKEASPVDWAMTQNNLGNTLAEQGSRTRGAEGARLLTEAISAFHLALEVRTKREFPIWWAGTQENLAWVNVDIAEHDSTEDPRTHFQAVLRQVENALEVFDPEHSSYNFEKVTRLRDEVQAKLNALITD